MKNRASLVLMEQLVMLLVFALAGALCLRAFFWAEQSSLDRADRDRALLCVQNMAQTLKSSRGDLTGLGKAREGDDWVLWYDGEWMPCETPGEYRLTVQKVPAQLPGLGEAQIRVWDRESEMLARLDVMWQEVGGNG